MYAATLYQVSGTAREDPASTIMSTTSATPETTSGSLYVLSTIANKSRTDTPARIQSSQIEKASI